jgi:hypothetical protein
MGLTFCVNWISFFLSLNELFFKSKAEFDLFQAQKGRKPVRPAWVQKDLRFQI